MGSITHANVLAALIMCTGIVLLLSPIVDAHRLSTNSQISRLNAGKVKVADFDTFALTQQGRFGHDALQNLSRQKDANGKATQLALRAHESIESAQRNIAYAWTNESDESPVADLRERLDLYPKGTSLPDNFLSFLKTDVRAWENWTRRNSCFDQGDKSLRCSLLQVDLNRDGQPEMVLWKTRHDLMPVVYSRTGQVWKRAGHLASSKTSAHAAVDIQTLLMTEDFTSKPSLWNELSIGESRFFMSEDE